MSCKPAGRSAHRAGRAVRLQLTALFVGLLGLVACQAVSTLPPSTEVTVRAGLALATANPGNFVQDFLNVLVSERPFLIGDDGRPVPRLVERWSASEDRLTWTLTLRPNLTFHDESPATALALRDTIERAARQPGALPSLRDIASVSVPDARTLVISLRRVSSFLLDDVSLVPFARVTPSGPVGAGAFVLESRSAERTMLRAFRGYYQGRPSIDRLELRVFPTTRAAWAATLRDEIDVLFEIGRDAVEFVDAESSVKVHSFIRPYLFVLWFSLRSPALASRDVRRAISLAIDREAIVRTALRGRGRAAEGLLWPGHWAYDNMAATYRHDPGQALSLLDQSGFKPKEVQGRIRRLKVTCLIQAADPLFESMALVVQRQLYDVGIDLGVETVPLEALVKRIGSGEFDAFLLSMASLRTLSQPYQFLRSPASGSPTAVDSGYTAADAALDRVRGARADQDVRAAVSALQRVLYEDPPGVFIAWDERARAVSRRFVVPAVPGRDIMPNFWQLRPATAVSGSE